ncbi:MULTISPECIES: hypothetical protein [unclassified Prochlorococcus]|uniref:hypothetical protein n=1 Tax=unclassified Prochlorococcus TaxID=2627481 RepID=UPI000533A098|nr:MULTISPECIES: hypothetical protein [unclassified Prochlorococcus]KGG27756.1 hypothetical protein EV13_1873 [Prochlorococcus sp. MIT 0702]KGG29633.1 hypothetical protein EV12_0042 [Prochlorococcus sp. MIT 0701]KGG34366.1 hypothetical protein EV14_1262 [Prochlorococcus sp. MIT 0703]
MTKETTPDFFEDRRRLAMELRDALESLRSLFVAAVSLVITIAGWRPRSEASKSTTSNDYQIPQMQAIPASSYPIHTSQSSHDSQPRSNSQTKLKSDLIPTSQPRFDWKAIEASPKFVQPERRKVNNREIAKDLAYTVMAAISTIALVVGVSRLEPIAERLEPIARWAKSQNECIESTSNSDGMNKANLPIKVMSCNGGHE